VTPATAAQPTRAAYVTKERGTHVSTTAYVTFASCTTARNATAPSGATTARRMTPARIAGRVALHASTPTTASRVVMGGIPFAVNAWQIPRPGAMALGLREARNDEEVVFGVALVHR
jgi:hypothetical protein